MLSRTARAQAYPSGSYDRTADGRERCRHPGAEARAEGGRKLGPDGRGGDCPGAGTTLGADVVAKAAPDGTRC